MQFAEIKIIEQIVANKNIFSEDLEQSFVSECFLGNVCNQMLKS